MIRLGLLAVTFFSVGYGLLASPSLAELNDDVVLSCKPVLSAQQTDALPQSVSVHNLGFEVHSRFSVATLEFANLEEKAVKSILVLIDFYNDHHLRVVTVAVNAVANANENVGRELSLKIEGIQRNVLVDGPIKGKSTRRIYGDSPKVMRDCPSEAQITLVQIKYVGGSPLKLKSLPNWHVDAFPLETPIFSKEKFEGYRFHTTAMIEIARYGQARLLDASNLDPRTRSLVEEVISSWVFSPAVDSGTPVETQAPLFISVGDCGESAAPIGSQT